MRQKACKVQMILANQVTRVRVHRQAHIGIRSRFSLSIANWICALVQSGAKLDAAMKGHVIAQGELVGRYARKK